MNHGLLVRSQGGMTDGNRSQFKYLYDSWQAKIKLFARVYCHTIHSTKLRRHSAHSYRRKSIHSAGRMLPDNFGAWAHCTRGGAGEKLTVIIIEYDIFSLLLNRYWRSFCSCYLYGMADRIVCVIQLQWKIATNHRRRLYCSHLCPPDERRSLTAETRKSVSRRHARTIWSGPKTERIKNSSQYIRI